MSSKYESLFKFVKLSEDTYFPMLTEDKDAFKLQLSFEVLEKINKTEAEDMQCTLLEIIPSGEIKADHLAMIAEMLDRYDYHQSGYTPCQANRTSIDKHELIQLTSKLWSNKSLKNENPEGYCRGRAYLTSKLLDEMGIQSNILEIKGHIFASYKVDGAHVGMSYLEHFVNIINVKEGNTTKQYVIDPMFTDGPIQMEKYRKKMSIDLYPETKYKIHHQSYCDKLAPPLRDNKCQYNKKLLKDYQKAIDETKNKKAKYFKKYKSHQAAKKDHKKALIKFNKSFN